MKGSIQATAAHCCHSIEFFYKTIYKCYMNISRFLLDLTNLNVLLLFLPTTP